MGSGGGTQAEVPLLHSFLLSAQQHTNSTCQITPSKCMHHENADAQIPHRIF